MAVPKTRHGRPAGCIEIALAALIDQIGPITFDRVRWVLQQVSVQRVAHNYQYALIRESCFSASSMMFRASPPVFVTSIVMSACITASAPVNEW